MKKKKEKNPVLIAEPVPMDYILRETDLDCLTVITTGQLSMNIHIIHLSVL